MLTLTLLTLLQAAKPDACKEYFTKKAVQLVEYDFDGDRKNDFAALLDEARGYRLTFIRGGTACQTWHTEDLGEIPSKPELRLLKTVKLPKSMGKVKAKSGVDLVVKNKPTATYYYDAGRKSWGVIAR